MQDIVQSPVVRGGWVFPSEDENTHEADISPFRNNYQSGEGLWKGGLEGMKERKKKCERNRNCGFPRRKWDPDGKVNTSFGHWQMENAKKRLGIKKCLG